MDETVVFQINAYMGGGTLVLSVMKENEIAFLKFVFAYFPAICFSLFVGIALQVLAVHFLIDVVCQSGTVDSFHGAASGTVGNTYPVGGFDIQTMVVFHVYVHIEADSRLCQFPVVVSGSMCATGAKKEGEQYPDEAGNTNGGVCVTHIFVC